MRFRTLRILVLLALLLMVVHHQWSVRARLSSWDLPVHVAIYPVNADGSSAARASIAALDARDFASIGAFLREQAERYALDLPRPMYVHLGRPVIESPPPAPVHGGFFERAAWIARLRWWRWRFDTQGLNPDIVVLARYHDPERSPELPHSTGVETLRVAVANLFADPRMDGANRVVVLHEVLHTLGASDKYDLATGQPIFPDGYADPERTPLHPQPGAEIMAGRIAVSDRRAEQAESLRQVVIGPLTAAEIGWLD